MESNYGFVTRQDIFNFPFPYKLWLVINLEYYDFLRWNRDGTVVLLDLAALEEYLNSTKSIFKIKNSSSFLKHLLEFKFDRLNLKPEAEEDVLLQYKNENFQRYRLDLLAKIRRHTYQLVGQIPTNNSKEAHKNYMAHEQCISILKRVSDRMLNDLCFMYHGGLSNIKRSRLHFQTILQFDNEKHILKKKLEASESAHVAKSNQDMSIRSTIGTSICDEDQVIELPVELFENPHDSVLNFEYLPEYAGYYGICTKEQIIHFFGEYLPMYEDSSQVLPDNSDNNCLPINTDANIAQCYSPNTAVSSNVVCTTPVDQDTMYNFNFSSTLEPIFITNNDCENIKVNNAQNDGFTVTHLNSSTLSNDDDISMDEFLKFKDSNTEYDAVGCQQITDADPFSQEKRDTKTFPQMPASFKMELSGDVKENEENFRNFFSQYRASLNLLYDRQ